MKWLCVYIYIYKQKFQQPIYQTSKTEDEMTDRREIGNFQFRDIFLFMVHVILFEKDFYDNEESRVTLDSLPQKDIYVYMHVHI